MAQISLDKYFMDIAELVKERSTCTRRKVGAVFVTDGRIMATGYNGAPSGVRHCNEEEYPRGVLKSGCTMENGHCIRANHAELNGTLNASQTGQSLVAAILYTTTYPCLKCLMTIRNAKVRKIVYKEDYPYSDEERQVFEDLEGLFEWKDYRECIGTQSD